MAKNKKKKAPKVIEHQPKKEVFTVVVVYITGSTSEYDNVIGTVTGHKDTYDHENGVPIPAVVPYNNFMVIQQKDRSSTYVNMDAVEELTISVKTDG